jgi:hypothetical protein
VASHQIIMYHAVISLQTPVSREIPGSALAAAPKLQNGVRRILCAEARRRRRSQQKKLRKTALLYEAGSRALRPWRPFFADFADLQRGNAQKGAEHPQHSAAGLRKLERVLRPALMRETCRGK